MLRSGEYIRFDALLQCPLDETEDIEDADILLEQVTPHSRIENVRTGPLIPLSELGERYNPLKTRKLHIRPKAFVTALVLLLFAPIWMEVFAPFQLDQWFGDGYLRATPRVVWVEGEEKGEVGLFVDRDNRIKVTVDRTEWFFNTPEELFARQGIQVGEVRARVLSREWGFVAVLSVLTILFAWLLLYMWVPGMFLWRSAKRRTTAALFALQRQKVGGRVIEESEE